MQKQTKLFKEDKRGDCDLERIIEEQKAEIEYLKAEVAYERLLRTKKIIPNKE
jgi:hypothetical protein